MGARSTKERRHVLHVIGMTSYFPRFVLRFSEIAELIIELPGKIRRFLWTELFQGTFQKLKAQLSNLAMLVFVDLYKPMILYTDKCDVIMSAILVQQIDDSMQTEGNTYLRL